MLPPSLCRLLPIDTLCWHPGAPAQLLSLSTGLLQVALMLSCCQLWGGGGSPGCSCARISPTKCQGTREPDLCLSATEETHRGRCRGDEGHQKHGACLSIRNISSALARREYSRRRSQVQSRKQKDSVHSLLTEVEYGPRQSSPEVSLCRLESLSKNGMGQAREGQTGHPTPLIPKCLGKPRPCPGPQQPFHPQLRGDCCLGNVLEGRAGC